MPLCLNFPFCKMRITILDSFVKYLEIYQKRLDIIGNIQCEHEIPYASPVVPGSHKVIEKPSAYKLPNNGLQMFVFSFIYS